MGLAMVGYTGYRDFQDNTGAKIGDLTVRVAVLERDADRREKRIDRLERAADGGKD